MDIRAHVVALNEKRAKAAKALEALIDDAHKAHPGEPLTAEERQTFDRINAEIDELEAEVRDFVKMETREQHNAELRAQNEAVFGGAQVERAEKSDADTLRSWFRGEGGKTLDVDIIRAAEIREAQRKGAHGAELRALLWDTGSVGSTVPTTLAATLYEYMEASVAMFRAPTTKITTAGGNKIEFPRLGTHAIGTQVIAQGTAIGGTDPVFEKMALDAYKYGQLVTVANEVIEDSAIDIVSFVGRDIGRGIGRLVDADLVVGTGSGEPQGIISTSLGTVATGGTLIPASYETLVDLVYGVADEYRASGSAGWLMNDATAGALRKLRDGAGGTVGAVLWEPSLTAGIQDGQPDRLLGFPVYTDPNVAAQGSAARAILFGDFSAYYVRQVGSIRLERSDDYAFNTDQVAFRGVWRGDGDIIDNRAFKVSRQVA